MNKNEERKLIRNIYILLVAILCLTIISSTAILSYVFFHWDDKNNNDSNVVNENIEYDVSEFTEINYDEFMGKFQSNEQSLIYIGRSTCIHCANFLPVLKKAQSDYNYETFYLDLSKISDKEATEIKKLDKFFNENFGVTPMVIIVKNNKLVSNDSKENGWIGESDYDDFSSYLESLGYNKN